MSRARIRRPGISARPRPPRSLHRRRWLGLSSCAIATACCLTWTACAAPPDEPPAGVVLVVLDTLRADHLGVYGHTRETSPSLDALAERGVVFEQAISFAPWTLPSMLALLSASLPSERVFRDGRLAESLVRTLQDSGVRTAAFTEGGFVSRAYGFALGFDQYAEQQGGVVAVDPGPDEGREPDPPGGIGATFAAAEAWLRENDRKPFFLLVHTYEPHTPYRRRFFTHRRSPGALGMLTFEAAVQEAIRTGRVTPGPDELDYVERLYDGGVRVADGHVGRLLAVLDELGLRDDTVVIVTSDHGEDLGERRPRDVGRHGHSLEDELVRVPLIVAGPLRDVVPGRVDVQVRTIDVLPTVLDWLQIPRPEGIDGRSLLPILRGAETQHRPALSRVARKGPRRASLRDGRWKVIRDLGTGRERVEPLDAAAGESPEPAGRDAVTSREAARLGRELDRQLEQLDARGPLDFHLDEEGVPAELRERLRALGYLR